MVEITPVDDNDDDIFSIESLVGPQLLKEVNKPTVATSTGAFGSNKTKKKKKTDKASSSSDNNNPPLLGLYFSASWCPPCQRFTPLLIDFYKIAKEVSPNDFEIVFISSDKNQEEFDEYVSICLFVCFYFIALQMRCTIIIFSPCTTQFTYSKVFTQLSSYTLFPSSFDYSCICNICTYTSTVKCHGWQSPPWKGRHKSNQI